MEEKKKVLTRRKYDADFKAEVLKMVTNGQTAAYVSHALGMSENLIYCWKQKTEGKEKATSGTESSSLLVENQAMLFKPMKKKLN